MAQRALLYYITDRTQFSGDGAQRRRKLLVKISEAAACGVDFIQLREKDLSGRELEALARQALEAIRNARRVDQKPGTRLVINSRSDMALAVAADGVHLRSHDISVREARTVYEKSLAASQGLKPASSQDLIGTAEAGPSQSSSAESSSRNWIVAASCHAEEEVRLAAAEDANFVVFAPVFEKKDGSRPAGLDALRHACQQHVPVLALGGVTLENAQSCLDAGAAGIAGIRLFQENDISQVVRGIRGW
jgi:thiamine-phosphate pyrophosphorylase